MPIVTAVFFLLNRIYRLLSKCRVRARRILANFSFWIYLFLILVFNDVSKFVYISSMQLSNLYRFNYNGVLLQSISVLAIGLWLLFCCSLYLLFRYFHKKTTLDMGNFRCNPSGSLVITFRYAIKPLVQGAAHYYAWSNTALQILLLFSFEVVSFCICCYCQVR